MAVHAKPTVTESYFEREGFEARRIILECTTQFESMVVRQANGQEQVFPLGATGSKDIDLGGLRMVTTVHLRKAPVQDTAASGAETALFMALMGQTGQVTLDRDAKTDGNPLPGEHTDFRWFTDTNGNHTVDFRYKNHPKQIFWDPARPEVISLDPPMSMWMPNMTSPSMITLGVLMGEPDKPAMLAVSMGKAPWTNHVFAVFAAYPRVEKRGVVCFMATEGEEKNMVALVYDPAGNLALSVNSTLHVLNDVPPIPLDAPMRICVKPSSSLTRIHWTFVHPNGGIYDCVVPTEGTASPVDVFGLCANPELLTITERDTPTPEELKQVLNLRWFCVHADIRSTAQLYATWENLTTGV